MTASESLEKWPRTPVASESAHTDEHLPVFGGRTVIVSAVNAYPSLQLVDPVTGPRDRSGIRHHGEIAERTGIVVECEKVE